MDTTREDSESAGTGAPLTIAHYAVRGLLGEGGMGRVYLAEDSRLGRLVALKVLPPEAGEDPINLQRFVREARLASSLSHAHIAHIYELGETESGHYIAMEYIDGRTLDSVGERPLELGLLVNIARQVADALEAAHELGIVHRDIKPFNIMLTRRGQAKVLDFGLAQLHVSPDSSSDVDTISGTIRYMSPEQGASEVVAPPSDIFAFGIVLYELATGVHPFDAKSAVGVLQRIIADPHTAASRFNPRLPDRLDALLDQMLDKHPALRPTASQIRAILTSLERDVIGRATGAQFTTAPETAYVGREGEMHELRALFADVAARRGMMVGITGEPGIGKSTLVDSFLAELQTSQAGGGIARGRCSERLAGTDALLPVIEALHGLTRGDDVAVAMDERLRRLAPSWRARVAERTGQSISGEPGAAQSQTTSPATLRRELAEFLAEASRVRPVVLVIEDLHWADASTIDMLDFLASQFGTSHLMIIATYRPSDLLLVDHPFLTVRPALQASGALREIALDFLHRDDVERLIELQFPANRFPADFLSLIHERTEGNPLFVSDVLRYLHERGVITRMQGRWTLARVSADIARDLPDTVRGLIQRKLDAVTPDDRRLLVAASVQGYRFDSATIAAALALDPADVEESIEVLERAHGLVRMTSDGVHNDGTPTMHCQFVHVLYQNTLYESLKPTRRSVLSGSVADALVRLHATRTSDIAAELAFLLDVAGEYERAASFFHLAAQNAARLGASLEGARLAQRGIAALDVVARTPVRDRLELRLQLANGAALIAAEGYGAAAVADPYARARELCRQMGATAELAPVLFGLVGFYAARGDLNAALAVAGELTALGTALADDGVMTVADFATGSMRFYLGDLEAARAHLERGVGSYDRVRHRGLADLFVFDPGVACLRSLALVSWLRGQRSNAARRLGEAERLAGEVGHAYSAVSVQCFGATLAQFDGDSTAALSRAEAALTLAKEKSFAYWVMWGTFLASWARSRGDSDVDRLAAVAELEEALAGVDRTGMRLFRSYWEALLADAYLRTGRVTEATAAVERGVASADATGERFWLAELLRLRATALVAGSADAHDAAVLALREAIAVAERQGASSLALRAAVELLRLLRARESAHPSLMGRMFGAPAVIRAARSRVESLCASLSGEESADLREARRMLDERRRG